MPRPIETIAVKSVAVAYTGPIPMTVTPGIGTDHKTLSVTSNYADIPAADDTDPPYTFKADTNDLKEKELAPQGDTCFAWDTTAGKINQDTTCGHVYYCLTGSFGSEPPPRVWGVQLTGYTPSGGLPKTLFQYSSGVNLYGDNSDVGPPF
ncbi:hypothetical protein B0H16DRAFT_1461455 [Mycena metata]|uniref:Uncharacterized protein n=1 Tax=Mycena metata TaxID=1033252 RepID=A0AAD7IRF1_9AGAR|nr:hypothetical protein B0H16DRAFT_1461455 [Mycena metata]